SGAATYLRGVIAVRRGALGPAARAFCEVAGAPEAGGALLDPRHVVVKDLARLGLGRIAHEVGDHDDAYYHYLQIPEDSAHLPEALYEAAWTAYQQRTLDSARDLVGQLLRDFPGAPVAPEARLLAGYVELADCRFDEAR